MARLNLPVVTIILNNDVLGWIKHIQKSNYQGNYISSDFTHVDFAIVAKGFGVKGKTIKTLDELDACLNKSTEPDGPVVIDILTDQWETPVLNFSPKGIDTASYGS